MNKQFEIDNVKEILTNKGKKLLASINYKYEDIKINEVARIIVHYFIKKDGDDEDIKVADIISKDDYDSFIEKNKNIILLNSENEYIFNRFFKHDVYGAIYFYSIDMFR